MQSRYRSITSKRGITSSFNRPHVAGLTLANAGLTLNALLVPAIYPQKVGITCLSPVLGPLPVKMRESATGTVVSAFASFGENAGTAYFCPLCILSN